MNIFQGLSLFAGLIVLGHGAIFAPELDPVAGWKFSDRIGFHVDVVTAYVDGDTNLTEPQESVLLNNTFKLEKLYNEMNEEFASYSVFSSISCIYARDHYEVVSRILKKLGESITARGNWGLILKGAMKKSVNMCLEGYSPRDYFYDLYNQIVLTEWKGYIMLTKFNDVLNSGRTPECFDENGNETDQENNYTSLHKNRLVTYSNIFQLMMEVVKCIPDFYACDEYHDFTKELGIFKSPSELNEKIRRQVLLKNSVDRRVFYFLYV